MLLVFNKLNHIVRRYRRKILVWCDQLVAWKVDFDFMFYSLTQSKDSVVTPSALQVAMEVDVGCPWRPASSWMSEWEDLSLGTRTLEGDLKRWVRTGRREWMFELLEDILWPGDSLWRRMLLLGSHFKSIYGSCDYEPMVKFWRAVYPSGHEVVGLIFPEDRRSKTASSTGHFLIASINQL